MTRNNNKKYPSQRFVPLLKSIRTLLRDYPVRAEMDSVQVMTVFPWRMVVQVQLAAGSSLAVVSRGLVEWDRTLVAGQVKAERSPCGAILRLGIAGKNEDDTAIEVWGVLAYDARHTGLLIDPGERIDLSVDQLAHWMLDDWTPGTNGSVTP